MRALIVLLGTLLAGCSGDPSPPAAVTAPHGGSPRPQLLGPAAQLLPMRRAGAALEAGGVQHVLVPSSATRIATFPRPTGRQPPHPLTVSQEILTVFAAWQRYCDGGAGMTAADWADIAFLPDGSIPAELRPTCTPPM